jgi:surfactin synthase thioesterase subunit
MRSRLFRGPVAIRNRQLIAVELQGHGRTADIDRPMTFPHHADDIAALLEYLLIPQADFFGESFGGTVAMQMAPSQTRTPRPDGLPARPVTPRWSSTPRTGSSHDA